MSNGELTKSFFESGGVEAEGSIDTASKIANATENISTAPPSPGSGGAGGPQF